MPANEVKQRKNKTPKQNDELSSEEASSSNNANCKDETRQQKVRTSSSACSSSSSSSSCVMDVRTIVCVLSVAACASLSWVVLRQNERFSQMEDKYTVLHGQTARLFAMEEDVLKVSKKLAASEDDLQEALSTAVLAARLRQDVSVLHVAVKAIQDDENSASRELEAVNGRFLNVTETWQARLSAVNSDLLALKAEAREAHAAATERVNEAEQRSRSLGERLDELEDSTKRNARALEHAEEEDFKRAQDQLDWNTKQIHKLDGQIGDLARSEEELSSQLREHVPKAEQCVAHLPQVEEAVRSILKLAGDLSAAERRLDEVTMQVYGTEDSMLKSLNEIAAIRRELDAVHAHNSILKMKNELSVVKEAVRELTMVLRSGRADGDEVPQEEEADGWMEMEDDEEWNDTDQDGLSQPVGDDDLTE